MVVGQFRAMSLLFSYCSSTDECRNEKGRRHFRAAAAGLKIDWFETFDPPAPVLRRLNQVAMGVESKR
jgi:hypothetical protein